MCSLSATCLELARDAGIICQKSSTMNDLKGIDLLVTLTNREDENLNKELKLDIKHSPTGITGTEPANPLLPYYEILDNNKVKLYVGASSALKNDQLLLDVHDTDLITMQSAILIDALEEIVAVIREINIREVREVIGRQALKLIK